MNIMIWSPGWTLQFGGVVALHRLCKLLRDRGADAAIWSCSTTTTPDIYRNPIIPAAARLGTVPDIAIYPEVVNGNPLGAPRVVRWLLNTPGVIIGHDGVRGDGIYGPGDLVCHYAAKFAVDYPWSEELYVFDLFPQWIHDGASANFPEPLQRHGACFVRRKGIGKSLVPGLGGRELTLYEQEPPRFGFYARHHSEFYCYDTASWLPVQAALCGCRSTVIPDDGVSAEQWRAGHWLFRYGVNYGLDDHYGDETLHLLRPWIAECEYASFRTVDRLLERLGHTPFKAEEARIPA